jgi:hypothetical protein
MEAYEALRDGLPVRAAAIQGGVADLAYTIHARPGMERRVAAELVPDWTTKRQEEIEWRSALGWAERIKVLLLIIHAREDWPVPLAEAQAMDATLSRLGREHKLPPSLTTRRAAGALNSLTGSLTAISRSASAAFYARLPDEGGELVSARTVVAAPTRGGVGMRRARRLG